LIAGIAIIISSAPDNAPSMRYRVSRLQLASIVIGIVLSAVFVYHVRGVSEEELGKFVASKFPAAAAQEVERARYQGPLYNSLNWGGYLIWRLPRLPVALDGRTNIFGDERTERSLATWSGQRDWQSDPELEASGVVIADPNTPLASLLHFDPRFKLVYEDAVATVFVKESETSFDLAACSDTSPERSFVDTKVADGPFAGVRK
jgi:hypothetical protein